jgi:hypothetical protein
MSFVCWWLGGNRTHAEHERFKVAQGRPRPLVAGHDFAFVGWWFLSLGGVKHSRSLHLERTQ